MRAGRRQCMVPMALLSLRAVVAAMRNARPKRVERRRGPPFTPAYVAVSDGVEAFAAPAGALGWVA